MSVAKMPGRDNLPSSLALRDRGHQLVAIRFKRARVVPRPEANQTAVHGSRRDRLGRLPVSWSARRRTEGRAQRHVSARAQHQGGREGAPLPLGPTSTIARNVMTGVSANAELVRWTGIRPWPSPWSARTRLLRSDAPRQPPSPCLKGRPALHFREKDAGTS
jgi:hypothetical protein